MGVRPLLESPVELAGLYPRTHPAKGFTGGMLASASRWPSIVRARARCCAGVMAGGAATLGNGADPDVDALVCEDSDDVDMGRFGLTNWRGRMGFGAAVGSTIGCNVGMCSIVCERRRARDGAVELDDAEAGEERLVSVDSAVESRPPAVKLFGGGIPWLEMSG